MMDYLAALKLRPIIVVKDPEKPYHCGLYKDQREKATRTVIVSLESYEHPTTVSRGGWNRLPRESIIMRDFRSSSPTMNQTLLYICDNE